MKSVYEVLLRSKKGTEQKTLVYWPTDEAKQDFLRKAKRKGIEVEVLNEK